MGDSGGLAKALALAAQLGFSIALPMVFFIGGGAWLDSKLGTSPLLLFVGIFLGLITAGGLFYQIAVVQPSRRRDIGAGKAPYKVEQKEKDKAADLSTPRADKWKRNGH